MFDKYAKIDRKPVHPMLRDRFAIGTRRGTVSGQWGTIVASDDVNGRHYTLALDNGAVIRVPKVGLR